jgi:ATP-binding cassette subfamily B protein
MASLDWQRLRHLLPYLGRDRRRLGLTLLLLIPLALAAAVQPLLVGQAISVLRGESVLPWLQGMPTPVALRLLVGLLLVAVLLRLALQGTQIFNVQVVGQRLTARIRDDLFRHAMALSLRFHDRTPVGKLLTRLTSDVDALAEVFGSGAVGVLADLVTLVVIGITMITIEWRLGLLLMVSQVPITLAILWLQRRYRRANYRVREELGQLNADLQENLQGLEVVQMFRREAVNSPHHRCLPGSGDRHDPLRQRHLGVHRVGGPGGGGRGARSGWLDGDRRLDGPWNAHHLHPFLPAPV